MRAPDTLDLSKSTARPGTFDWYRDINQPERRIFWSCKITAWTRRCMRSN
ncbi:hypothetical protein [Pseudomonas sp. RIT288]|nr:major facilitator transporter [Pseudomonas sp. RIT288]